MITYNGLWKELSKKGTSQYSLIMHHGFSPAQLYRLRHNCYVSTYTIERFCNLLGCDVGDIMSCSSEDSFDVD